MFFNIICLYTHNHLIETMKLGNGAKSENIFKPGEKIESQNKRLILKSG